MEVRNGIAVIGGGITGLACAWGLKKSGFDVRVFEASDRTGGLIHTVERSGFLFEMGPQCPRYPQKAWDLLCEMGLKEEFVAGDSGAARYILKNGELHRAPLTPWGLLSTRLVNFRSKVSILGEPLRTTVPPDSEESLSAFAQRKFSSEILDYLIDPFVATILAMDPEKLGMESAFPDLVRWERDEGSLMRGAIKSLRRNRNHSGQESPNTSTGKSQWHITKSLPRLGSFAHGLATFTGTIAKKLGDAVCLNSRVEKLELAGTPNESGRWRVALEGNREYTAAAVVIAAPAREASRIAGSASPELSRLLAGISYAPLAVVSSAYHRDQVNRPLEGFGVLIPRRENLETLCIIWNSALLPGRAPDGKVLITSYLGGATNPGIASMSDAEISAVAQREAAKILGIAGEPLDEVVQLHSQGLPQFNVGHAQTVRAVKECLRKLPGLYLAGNYLKGRSIGDCIESASRAADEVRLRVPAKK
jgi:oxygen-dependent protoporphyrinogen oxidase